MKKLLSLALAMAMALSLSLASVSADNSDSVAVAEEGGPLCPHCHSGNVRLTSTHKGLRMLVGRIPCNCRVGAGQDGIFETLTVSVYECDNYRCGIGYFEEHVFRETPHLN